MEQLNGALRNFIVENFLFGQPFDFSDNESFLKKGIIDSTGVVELVSWVEERYGIRVEDEEIVPDNLDSINNLCRFIERKTCVVR
jgi:acyl carrier protein